MVFGRPFAVQGADCDRLALVPQQARFPRCDLGLLYSLDQLGQLAERHAEATKLWVPRRSNGVVNTGPAGRDPPVDGAANEPRNRVGLLPMCYPDRPKGQVAKT